MYSDTRVGLRKEKVPRSQIDLLDWHFVPRRHHLRPPPQPNAELIALGHLHPRHRRLNCAISLLSCPRGRVACRVRLFQAEPKLAHLGLWDFKMDGTRPNVALVYSWFSVELSPSVRVACVSQVGLFSKCFLKCFFKEWCFLVDRFISIETYFRPI